MQILFVFKLDLMDKHFDRRLANVHSLCGLSPKDATTSATWKTISCDQRRFLFERPPRQVKVKLLSRWSQ